MDEIKANEPDLMSLAEVARRCKVAMMTARSWPKGIRVGGEIVKLRCVVIGTRARVSEADLKQFQVDCHKAMFGEEPTTFETPAQFARRTEEDIRQARILLGDDPDSLPRPPRKKRA
ncbi:hypothetical protein [Limnoglobus roseus]|uniref:Uncharacterized protein n=1 Tax=Limnoglobus roseus TaxID=2598579 RepID=A0A5C1A8Q8_9BACT|nr:hypothetical protein [Limnoglobus roseus]QEL14152.1 hypothetical protein PX52LOC_01022 [Limnoglobus roseus]